MSAAELAPVATLAVDAGARTMEPINAAPFKATRSGESDFDIHSDGYRDSRAANDWIATIHFGQGSGVNDQAWADYIVQRLNFCGDLRQGDLAGLGSLRELIDTTNAAAEVRDDLQEALQKIASERRFASDYGRGDSLHYRPFVDAEQMACEFNRLVDAARVALAKVRS